MHHNRLKSKAAGGRSKTTRPKAPIGESVALSNAGSTLDMVTEGISVQAKLGAHNSGQRLPTALLIDAAGEG
jgi:hypothetical protein